MRGELQNVKEENNRQQQLLAQNLQLPPEARIEASLQHEITRLTNENLVRPNTPANYTQDNGFRKSFETLSTKTQKYTHTWTHTTQTFIQQNETLKAEEMMTNVKMDMF